MAETLGSLCDKLTIVKLKQWHSSDKDRLSSLSTQERQLVEEIDEYVSAALSGEVPAERLVSSANKVFPKEGNDLRNITGELGELVSELAKVNCDIWHVQEKVYQFDAVPADEKNSVIKQLAVLNLERSVCCETIDRRLCELVGARKGSAA